MSKNKLIWNIALFLIALISLPIVYAQVPLTTTLYFVLVNAAVIGIILFLLQAFILPEKPEKERVAIWFIVAVISLILAWFFGSANYIWRGPLGRFFNIYVLINTIVITAFLYFIFGLMKVNEKLGKEGQKGYLILVIIIAVALTLSIAPDKFIWKQEAVSSIIDYFFGQRGVFNPKHGLWIFISSFLLISFFFNIYLLKEGAGGKTTNYLLAFVFAATMARAGLSLSFVIMLGEVLFVLVIQRALKDNVQNVRLQWIIALVLVGWASYAITSQTKYFGILGFIFGIPFSAFGLGKQAVISIGWKNTLGAILGVILGIIVWVTVYLPWRRRTRAGAAGGAAGGAGGAAAGAPPAGGPGAPGGVVP